MPRDIFGIFIIAQIFWADAKIFVYHRFDDLKHKSTSISVKKLRDDFLYLKQHNYKVVPLQTIIKLLKEKKEVPDNFVALTIDDGYKSFFQNGLKVFKEFNYPFTVFVYVEATQKRYGDFMRWEELKQSSKFGEIALHSYSHPHLTYLTLKQVKADTKKALTVFQKYLHFKPKGYAYPFGEFNPQVQKIIKEFGFEYICNQNVGAVSKNDTLYDIDRIAVTDDTNIASKLKIKSLQIEKFDIIRDKNYIKNIHVVLKDKNTKTVEFYISGYGWKRVKVNKSGIYKVDKILKFKRNRVIIRVKNSLKTKLIMKG